VSAPLTRDYTVTFPGIAATASDTYVITAAEFAGELAAAYLTADSNITGAASPASRTYTIVNKGQDGNGTTVMATLALVSGVNPTDFNEEAFTLSAVEGATEFVQGDVIAVASTAVGGTGLADPGGAVRVTLSRT
jgi:hypothetical protein